MSQSRPTDYEDRRNRALAFLDAAFEVQKRDQLDRSESLYRRSIALYPTAEGYTFLGWVVSMQGRLEEAIEICRRAIEIDADFGNPYNDIGAYLIELGRPDDAVPYLKKAVTASRYECYFYAHYNLGRVWESKGHLGESLKEYQKSLDQNPNFTLAEQAIERISKRMKSNRDLMP